MKKNKYLPYVLFGVPILIGVYFVLKNLKVKSRNQSQEPETQPTNPVKDVVNTVKDVVSGYTPSNTLPLKKGMSSGYVRAIQRVLGLTQDAKFGSKTESAVKTFQSKNLLKSDGIVGQQTWMTLFGASFPNENLEQAKKIQANAQKLQGQGVVPNVSATNEQKPFDFNKPFGF